MSRELDQPPNDIVAVPDEQRARQAIASLGGHLFQATRAATEWVQLSDDATLLIEVAEDYAVLARGALAMTQTKQEYSASVTLRSDGVRKSLAGLVAFQEANAGMRVSLTFLTTAVPGIEAKSALPSGVGGIAYWQEVARGADIAPLRQLLLETQHDEVVLKRIREADDESLRSTIVQSVTWLTGSPGLEYATGVLESRLRLIGVQRTGYAADGESALPLIVHRILRTAVSEDRRLTRDDFEQEWALATTIPVSVTMLRNLSATGAPVVPSVAPELPPPALSPRTAVRHLLVDSLRADLRMSDVMWLHGSSGLGKSLLARLVEARGNGRWEFVSLKDCDAAEQTVRLRSAIGRIERDDFAGLILDDVPVPAPEGLRRLIAAASLEISAIPSARIIVTSEREPLPQIRQAFEPLQMQVRDAPYFEKDDVRDIVAAAGGDPDTWAALIHLTCGGGHPLLVDARVAGLASKGWPAGERLNGLGVGDGPSEVAEVRREVSLRLLDELSTDAHMLLLRLSGLFGSFDGQLVDAVAAIEPAIQRARVLLEYLVGPWIEIVHSDRYRLSPLLQASAATLSETERTNVHTVVIENLIKRNPFPADLLSSLILYVMIRRHLGGFIFVAQAVMSTSHRAELAFELFPLVYMKSGDGGLLLPENAGVSAIVRTAQVIAAVNADPPSMVESVVAEALEEASKLDGKLRGANSFATLTAVLGNVGADLAPKTWMPMLVQFHDMWISGNFPAEMTELLTNADLGGVTPEQMFFAVRSNKVDTIADLEELFAQLERVNPEWRHTLLAASTTLFKGPPLFVQGAWSREMSTNTLDAARGELVYQRLAEQAATWGEIDVAIECFRSQAVLLDEYLDRHEDALTLLTDAESRFGSSERLVRSRATVLSTMGRHQEEFALLSTLSPAYSQDDPLERLMMLRTSAISAGKLKRFAQSAQFFHDAYKVAKVQRPEVLGGNVPPGLLADAAAMEVRDGRIADALTSLVLASEVADSDQSADPSLNFARASITQVTQWAAANVEGRAFPEDPSANPGVCSTLRPTFDPAELSVRKQNQEWYLIARLEAIAGIDVGAQQRLLKRERIDGVHLNLAVGVTATQMEAYIATMDEVALFGLLPRYAWVSARLIANGRKDTLVSADEQTTPEQWGKSEADAARALVSGLLGMLLVEDRFVDAVSVSTKARAMSSALAFQLEDKTALTDNSDIVAVGLAALQVIIDETVLNAEELLRASVQVFIWLKYIGANELSAKTHGILSRRWLKLCKDQRGILSNPRLAVPTIEAATGLKPSVAAIARLVEAGRLASALGLPANIIEMLKTTR